MTATAIISDTHGDLLRLRAVLADIARRNITRTISLGDNVDERPAGAPVLTELLARHIPSVLGNCDQLCDLDSGSPEDQFVRSMPREFREADVLFTHISPVAGARGLRDLRDAAQLFRGTRQRLCFVGHIHIPAIFTNDPANPDEALAVPFHYSTPVSLDPARRYAICVGAVGQGRDGIPEPRYAIWDDTAATVEIVRVT